MRLVIRLSTAPERRVAPARRPNQQLALATALFLGALAAGGFALCAWRWGDHFQIVGAFPFPQGFLSHWQTWFAVGLLLQGLSTLLSTYARGPAGGSEAQRRVPRRRIA